MISAAESLQSHLLRPRPRRSLPGGSRLPGLPTRHRCSLSKCAGSGTIDVHEMRAVLRALGQFPTAAELAELMQRMDANQVRGSGWGWAAADGCAGMARSRATHRCSTARCTQLRPAAMNSTRHATRVQCPSVCPPHGPPSLPPSLPPPLPPRHHAQDGSICFEEFEAAMTGQAEDEETERQLREIRVRRASICPACRPEQSADSCLLLVALDRGGCWTAAMA